MYFGGGSLFRSSIRSARYFALAGVSMRVSLVWDSWGVGEGFALDLGREVWRGSVAVKLKWHVILF